MATQVAVAARLLQESSHQDGDKSMTINSRARRRAGMTVAALATSVAITAGTTGTAQAGPLPLVSSFTDLATGFVLDSNFSGAVYTMPWNGGNYQKWVVRPSDYGTVTLQDVATGRCLDSNTSGAVYTLPCNGGSFQKWHVLDRDYGTKVLRDLATGRVLDSNHEGRVYTLPENGGSYQKWIPRPA